MNLMIYLTVFGVLLVGYTKAQQQDGGDPYSKDEIFIDGEDGIEGSGGGRGGEVKDDLESSGSGNGPGPDDEDGYETEISVENPKLPPKPLGDPYRPREPEIEKHPQTPLETVPNSKENEIGAPPSSVGGGTGGLPPTSEDGDFNEVRPDDGNQENNDVYIMDTKPEERATSFFSQPGILAAVIGGAVVGLLCAILVVMFVVYRMRKKDEGSYALDEPKRSPTVNSYTKNSNREFYA
ncbi:syndecan-like isoform X2 [Ischnura elegans]|uniref:syndecan-like isoform X2 n=1 Tax=Ischnura elegans TaxID=197161 RepID=UPI001ED89C4A|nr:syndecan-like isoform X2 [Ischnura elegans]